MAIREGVAMRNFKKHYGFLKDLADDQQTKSFVSV